MQPEVRSVSLITYNIHKGFGVGAVRFLLPEMRDAIAGLNPDFVFLQEVQGKHRKREKELSVGLIPLNVSTLLRIYGHITFMQRMQYINLATTEMLF